MTLEPSNKLNQSLQRFSNILSQAEIQAILDTQEQPLSTSIRLNALKTTPHETIHDLSQRYGWQLEPIHFCKNAWKIIDAETSPGGTIEHRMGMYYLQDAASMVPVSLFEINQSEPLILDLAASPGGKTTHLIDRSGDKGLIIANDGSQGRIPALRAVLETWGGINQVITNYPGEPFGGWFPETFDIVLLDAPCSMENLRPTPNHPLRETSTDERLRLKERQIQLLSSGLQALKTGGQLVYATCSLAPEEDEAVISALLDKYPDTFEIEDVSKQFQFKAPGLTAFEGETYHPQLIKSMRLWPHLTNMSGFFCALLTKHGEMETGREMPPNRDFSATHLEPLRKDVKIQIMDQIKQNYGFNLENVLEAHAVDLFKRFDQLFLIPQIYIDHFSTLPYEYIGMPLGQWHQNSLVPSHAFASRFGREFTRGIIVIEDSHVGMWISGRDIRHPQNEQAPKGQYLLVNDQDERNLGLGKLLPKRLRNMLPRGLI
ncbi:MAG TPA: hypothetical protein DCL08_06660 [Anaerolineaceae bacterium]|nr:MAG: Putative RNA methylase, NOL1/NOP2/sun family [Anaerolineaceae bacterium 46_22]HAF48906.1 hypothetical protein [Anaerolineaceae bacterium]